MDKSIYCKRKQIKIFGKVIYEHITDYEGIDLEDVEPINPIILLGKTKNSVEEKE